MKTPKSMEVFYYHGVFCATRMLPAFQGAAHQNVGWGSDCRCWSCVSIRMWKIDLAFWGPGV
jgi:hypothetical protein